MKKRTGLGICLLLCAALLLTGCRDAGLPSVSAPSVSHASAVSAPNAMSEIPSDLSENESVPPDVPEPLFTFDPHLLSEDAKRYLGDDLIPLYTRAVDSILAHDGVVEDVASEADFYRVWHVILFENYALRAMIHNANTSETPWIYTDGRVQMFFRMDAAACEAHYRAFAEIINQALAQLREEDDDWARTAKLYAFVSAHMAYGNVYDAYGIESTVYDAIVCGLGICGDYAVYLGLLLRHCGIPVMCGYSWGEDDLGGADHMWTLACLDGSWYHFDACWQAADELQRFGFFGMDDEERYQSLSMNNFAGIAQNVSMFCMDWYTSARGALPECPFGLSAAEREQMYAHVYGAYPLTE